MRSVVRPFRVVVIVAAIMVCVVAALLVAAVQDGTSVDRPSADATVSDDDPAPSTSDAARVDLMGRVERFAATFTPDDGYRVPTTLERETLAVSVGHVLDGRSEQARRSLKDVGYRLRRATDTGTGRGFWEVYEDTPTRRGWGRVYIDADSPVRRVIEIPHPVADRLTEVIGVDVFRRAPGSVLLVAGAHRRATDDGSSDVAHRDDSVFDAIAGELTRRMVPAIQIHGFDDDTVPDEDVVLSTGTASADLRAEQAAELLETEGLRVCRVWSRNNDACEQLEALTNAQGRTAGAAGLPFLHVECSRTIRDDPAWRSRVAATLARLDAP